MKPSTYYLIYHFNREHHQYGFTCAERWKHLGDYEANYQARNAARVGVTLGPYHFPSSSINYVEVATHE